MLTLTSADYAYDLALSPGPSQIYLAAVENNFGKLFSTAVR